MKMKLFLLALSLCLITINSQEAKYIELKPLEIFNLTEITYKTDTIKLDEDLQKEFDELTLLKNHSRVAACMLILRTNLGKGNQLVTQTLKETKHNKEKTYDKIVAQMLDTCNKKITEDHIEKILRPENVNLWEDAFGRYLEFNKNIFQIIGPEPKLTTSEQTVMSDIAKVVEKPGIELTVEEPQVDFFTEKLGKYKYMAFGMIIGFSISLLFSVVYSIYLKK